MNLQCRKNISSTFKLKTHFPSPFIHTLPPYKALSDSQFQHPPERPHQTRPIERHVHAPARAQLWKESGERVLAFSGRPVRLRASALFWIWSPSEGCLCICRYLLNTFDSSFYSHQQGGSAAPQPDSLWQQMLTVSKPLNNALCRLRGDWRVIV